ncbi:hypothetical protein HDU97_004718 [Phlyctochytrium planicorne]|nr:hypothetical protein HDU97_004718 [Phlyctochytrium planicorne]
MLTRSTCACLLLSLGLLFSLSSTIVNALPQAPSSTGSIPTTPSAFVSISVASNSFYVVDESTNLWKSTDRGASWTYLYTNVKCATPYDKDMMAVGLTTTNISFLEGPIANPSKWEQPVWIKQCIQVAGTRQGVVWGNCRGTVRLIANNSFSRDDWLKSPTSLAIRDKVYVKAWFGDEQTGTICSRDLIPISSMNDPHVCAQTSFGMVSQLAVSTTTLFVLAEDGTLHSTRLPVTTASTFVNTGFISSGARSIVIPIDDEYPVLVDYYGRIQIVACNSDDTKCSIAPPPATSTSTSLTLPTAEPTSSSNLPTLPTSTASLQSLPAIALPTLPAQSPQPLPLQTSKHLQTLQQLTTSTIIQQSPTPEETTPLQTQSASKDSSTPTIPTPALIIGLGILILLIMVVLAGLIFQVILIQRTSAMTKKMDEAMAFMKETGKKMSRQRQREMQQRRQQQPVARQNETTREAGPSHAQQVQPGPLTANDYVIGVLPEYQEEGNDEDDEDEEDDDD